MPPVFRPLELFVGLRQLRSRQSRRLPSLASLVSMLGVALGIAALIVVLSIMNGFHNELRERILAVTSHATMTGPDGTTDDWAALREQALQHPATRGAAPFVHGEGMAAGRRELAGVIVRGVLPGLESGVSEIAGSILAGVTLDALEPGSHNALLGRGLAARLGVQRGDRVNLLVGRERGGSLRPRIERFNVSGVFSAGHFEYDDAMVLVHLDDASQLLRLEGRVSGIRLRFDDLFEAPRIVSEIARRTSGDFQVNDWTREHTSYFRAIRLEKAIMFAILFLIVGVAVINIVSTLVMVVTDKRAEIAILRTIGVRPRGVAAIFMVQGVAVGLVGTLIGIAAGVLVAANVESLAPLLERLFQLEFLPADVFLFTELPSELKWADVALVAGFALLLAIVSTLYPAWRASRTGPAEALRYE